MADPCNDWLQGSQRGGAHMKKAVSLPQLQEVPSSELGPGCFKENWIYIIIHLMSSVV